MNKYILKSGALLTAALLMSPFLTSCSDDDEVTPEFYIENVDFDTYDVSTDYAGFGISSTGYIDKGTANKYTVRCNTSWEVVVEGEEGDDLSWVVLHAAKGVKDGIFYMAVKENTSYYPRTARLLIKVKGEEEPQVVNISQTGAAASVFASENSVLRGNGGAAVVGVSANLNWTAELDDDYAWLSIDSITSSQVVMTAAPNPSEEIRYATLNIIVPEIPSLNRTVKITQYDQNLIYYDDFEYLTGSNLTSWSDSNTQTNMVKWTTDQLETGWSCWHDTYFDTDALSSNIASSASLVYRGTYDGNSWLKLGKTSWCGTAVSPALTSLNDGETVDVTVSFCACIFRTAGSSTTNPGKYDQNRLMVGVYGPGAVENPDTVMKNINVKYVVAAESVENGKLNLTTAQSIAKADMSGDYPVALFHIDVYTPNKNAATSFYPKPLDPSVAQLSLVVKGVTNQTHLVFFGGGYDYFNADDDTDLKVVGSNGTTYSGYRVNKCNRVFLDNIMVSINN
jgi:hypothetical protein